MPPIAVIDTNVWLDLFVFRDPRVASLDAALREGTVAAASSPAINDEIGRVLAREAFQAHPVQDLLRHWRLVAREVVADAPAPWRCTDPDDQKFLDLAVQVHARWLFSKDRALLRLASRARLQGLEILVPRPDWSAPGTIAADRGGGHP